MPMRVCITVAVIAVFYSFGSLAATQVTPPVLEEQREQQRQIDEEIQRRLQQRPSPTAPKIEIEAPVVLLEGQCQTITQVFLYGADHFPERKRKKIYTPYLGRCLDNDGIGKLARSVQEWYLQAGYITTRVNLKQRQSSLDRGNLEMWVIEGRIGRFILGENTAFDESRIKAAFPVTSGDVLNIHDLDQGIEQLNRLFSQSFRMQIRPGERPGFSDIFLIEYSNNNTLIKPIKSHPKFGRRQIGYQYNNGGIDATGLHLHNLNFKRENLFGVNDVMSLGWQRGSPYLPKQKENEVVKFDISVPSGYWLYKLNYYSGRTDRTVPGTPSQFQSRGDTATTRLSANKVIYRDKQSKLEGFGNFELSDRRNYINDTLVQVSSRLISSVNVGLVYTRYFAQSTFIVSPTISQGVPWFGALGDTPGKAASDPHAEYTKLALYSFYKRPISITKNQDVTYEATLSAQYSPLALYGEKQFVIGGEYSVRGFKENVLSDDSGWSVRNDLVFPVGQWTLKAHKSSRIAPLNLKLFADVGKTYSVSGIPAETLAGWGYGMDYHYRWFEFYFNRAISLNSSTIFSATEGWVNYYGLRTKLTF